MNVPSRCMVKLHRPYSDRTKESGVTFDLWWDGTRENPADDVGIMSFVSDQMEAGSIHIHKEDVIAIAENLLLFMYKHYQSDVEDAVDRIVDVMGGVVYNPQNDADSEM